MWVKIQTPAISTKTSSKDTQNQPNNKIKGRDRVVLIRSIVYRDTRDNYRIMIYLPSHVQIMLFSSSCLKSHSTLSKSHIYVLTHSRTRGSSVIEIPKNVAVFCMLFFSLRWTLWGSWDLGDFGRLFFNLERAGQRSL